MKKGIRWLLLLTKRLYKKPAFVAILALLPILTLLYSSAARQDSGMVTVALALEDPADALACRLTDDLMADSPLIRFTLCQSPAQAEAMVTGGKADGAWIFPAGLGEKLARFPENPETPVVLVMQREETTALRLARETLSGVLYRALAQPAYLSYIRENTPALDGLSDQALLSYYEGISGNENLFQFWAAGGASAGEPTGYLLSPLRGLLGILMAVCALAAALYFGQDRRTGTFDRVPLRLLPLAELGCQAAALLSVGAVALVCLTLCGLSAPLEREAALTALYCLCCAGFSMLLRRLCPGEGLLAGSLPVLTALMLAVCPVFFDISALRLLQWLLPPTYYIRAVCSDTALFAMPLYTSVCFLLCLPFRDR